MQPVKDDLTPTTVSKRATQFNPSPSSPPEAEQLKTPHPLAEDYKREDEGPDDPVQIKLPPFCCIDSKPAENLTTTVKNDTSFTVDFTFLHQCQVEKLRQKLSQIIPSPHSMVQRKISLYAKHTLFKPEAILQSNAHYAW